LTAAVRPARPVAAEGTDPGRERENNEDRVLCDPERGIFAVIDGVGGESGGEVAAQAALDILRARLSRRTTDLDRLVREAIAQANRQIFERAQADPRLAGMSCVLTVAILDGDHGGRATVGHVGDSRLYRLRRGEIRKVTRDHSPVGAREDAGELSEDEAMHHPRRNEIFRDVGSALHEPDEEGFIDTQEIPFGPDDALLFCSDGLSDMVPSARIREIVESNAGDPRTAVQRLIEAANEAGGKDNISVVLVEGERYAALAPARPSTATSPTSPTSPTIAATATSAPRQYGSASVRVPGWRRALPWALLLVVLAAAAAVYFVPALRERLVGDLLGGITGPGEAPTPTPGAPDLSAALRVGPGETDFATIHEALAEARRGQTVEVAPGEYREAIELPEGVSLVSLQPRAAVLHPPAGSKGPVLTARGVDGRISGFRIAGEKNVPLAVGLRLDGSRVQVSEMEITGAAEAGIEITGPDRSSIETSFVHDNAGPGILVSGGAATQIEKNLISKNGKAKKAPGVEVRDDARPLLIDNRFEGNAAAGVWLPTAERADEIFGWNRFEGSTRAKAVQVAPRQAQPPSATPTPGQGH
jgi:serine/threonine protein phosphatase PrpC